MGRNVKEETGRKVSNKNMERSQKMKEREGGGLTSGKHIVVAVLLYKE